MTNKASLFTSVAALVCVIALGITVLCGHSCKDNCTAETECAGCQTSGKIVYFNLDKVIDGYSYAVELQDKFNKKAGSVNEEINRKAAKLEADVKTFQEKINKGVLVRSAAEQQGARLEQTRQEIERYAAEKQQDLAVEQQEILGNIANAINDFIERYNKEKGYGMILSTQGDLMTAPVVIADESLDVTEDILNGLNAEYAKK